MDFAKGHGTHNDFVIIPDENAQLDLTAEVVSTLCDRRGGIGGDGVLRVARTGALVDAGELDAAGLGAGIERDTWFMDYRNADGSLAEMCGNGARVFAHWVRSRGLEEADTFVIGTRAGARKVTVSEFDDARAQVTVEMGEPKMLGISQARMGGRAFAGLGVDVGNPHLAAVIPGLTPDELDSWELVQPEFDADFFPTGVNVEIVTPLRDGAVSMRVYERGSGETMSCGTGTIAAAAAALADAEQGTGEVRVTVPGGEVAVEILEDGSRLTGPSAIVATGKTLGVVAS